MHHFSVHNGGNGTAPAWLEALQVRHQALTNSSIPAAFCPLQLIAKHLALRCSTAQPPCASTDITACFLSVAAIQVASAEDFVAKVKGAGGDIELHIYEGLGHAFLNVPDSKWLLQTCCCHWAFALCMHDCHYVLLNTIAKCAPCCVHVPLLSCGDYLDAVWGALQ